MLKRELWKEFSTIYWHKWGRSLLPQQTDFQRAQCEGTPIIKRKKNRKIFVYIPSPLFHWLHLTTWEQPGHLGGLDQKLLNGSDWMCYRFRRTSQVDTRTRQQRQHQLSPSYPYVLPMWRGPCKTILVARMLPKMASTLNCRAPAEGRKQPQCHRGAGGMVLGSLQPSSWTASWSGTLRIIYCRVCLWWGGMW